MNLLFLIFISNFHLGYFRYSLLLRKCDSSRLSLTLVFSCPKIYYFGKDCILIRLLYSLFSVCFDAFRAGLTFCLVDGAFCTAPEGT